MNATVKDVMTTPVVAVKRDTTYKELAARLREHRVSAFPVVDDQEKVVGVVSEADMLAKEALSGDDPGRIAAMLHRREREKADGLTAGDLMTDSVVTVTPEDTVEHAARLMYMLKVKRLPVVDQDGHLLGIISRADVLSVFDRPDEEIRQEIIDGMLLHEFLIDPRQFKVTVQSGVVTLAGRPETVALGHALVRKTRHVRGVVAVHDGFTYPEDYPLHRGADFLTP